MKLKGQVKAQYLEELAIERRHIVADLHRVVVRETYPPEKQDRVIKERRPLKSRLKAIDQAIKSAGGSINPYEY